MVLSITLALGVAHSQSLAEDLLGTLLAQPVEQIANTADQLGNAAAGAKIFKREKLGCVKCHVAPDGSEQKPIGPNLTWIGDRLKPAEIVRSIVDPNATITEGYQSFIVLRADADVINGVRVSESDKEVVLAVPDKGHVRIARDDIEKMRKGKSAMPGDVVNQMGSEQAFYDLIAYLVSRKASASGTANHCHRQTDRPRSTRRRQATATDWRRAA